MEQGMVEMLLIIGGNPVYTAPADFPFTEALDKVGLRLHHSLYYDETSAHCHWHIPATHYLEEWSDARAFDGTVSIIQPLIEPLYDNKSAHELLAAFSDQPDSRGYDLIRNYWMKRLGGTAQGARQSGADASAPSQYTSISNGGAIRNQTASSQAPAASATEATQTPPLSQNNVQPSQQSKAAVTTPMNDAAMQTDNEFANRWQEILRLGIVRNTALKERTVALNFGLTPSPSSGNSSNQEATPMIEKQRPANPQEVELVLRPDPSIYDGRFANNGWLQELPKPLTKLTWGNAAMMSPATAARLGLEDSLANAGGEHGQVFADVVELDHQGHKITAPVLIVPGHADDAITLSLGYGRTRAGQTGSGVGFNAYALHTSDAPWIARGVTVRQTSEQISLACT
jgi:molybdopterin-containing oxidoreductase family iron-sulfur binding subunit